MLRLCYKVALIRPTYDVSSTIVMISSAAPEKVSRTYALGQRTDIPADIRGRRTMFPLFGWNSETSMRENHLNNSMYRPCTRVLFAIGKLWDFPNMQLPEEARESDLWPAASELMWVAGFLRKGWCPKILPAADHSMPHMEKPERLSGSGDPDPMAFYEWLIPLEDLTPTPPVSAFQSWSTYGHRWRPVDLRRPRTPHDPILREMLRAAEHQVPEEDRDSEVLNLDGQPVGTFRQLVSDCPVNGERGLISEGFSEV